MKKLLLVLTLINSINCFSQNFFWGTKIGISSTKLNLYNIENNTIKFKNISDVSIGYDLGIFSRISFLGIFVQPEIIYSQINSNFNISNNFSDNYDIDISLRKNNTVKINKLDIPILFGKNFFKITRFNAGPVFSYLINQRNKTGENNHNTEINFFKSNIRGQIGTGLNLPFLIIDIRYEFSLNPIGNKVNIEELTIQSDQRINSFLISIGIKL